MSDRIDFGGKPWHAIPRDALRDERLSLKAHGALGILLSHDEGWVRSAIATIMRESTSGRDQAKAAMAELREAGYAELVTERDLEGRLRRHYVIFAEPRSSEAQTSGSLGDGKPIGRETHRTGNPVNEVEAPDVEALDVEPKALTQRAPRARDVLFDALADVAGADPRAMTAAEARACGVALAEIRKASPDVTVEELERRAANYATRFPGTLTPNALARHWSECAHASNGHVRDRAAEIMRGAIAQAEREPRAALPGGRP